jgi:hypothetical protein
MSFHLKGVFFFKLIFLFFFSMGKQKLQVVVCLDGRAMFFFYSWLGREFVGRQHNRWLSHRQLHPSVLRSHINEIPGADRFFSLALLFFPFLSSIFNRSLLSSLRDIVENPSLHTLFASGKKVWDRGVILGLQVME